MTIVEVPHYFYFFDKAFFSILFAISCLLWKGLDCKFLLVLETLHQIHWSEVALTNFFYWLELLVETHLIQSSLQLRPPLSPISSWQPESYLVVLEVECQFVIEGHEPEIETKGKCRIFIFDGFFIELHRNGLCFLFFLPNWLIQEGACGFWPIFQEKCFFHI